MKDNTGRQVIAAGTEYDNRALWLEGMDWLVEGVIGSGKG
jgi:basic membrane protein A and related proteins